MTLSATELTAPAASRRSLNLDCDCRILFIVLFMIAIGVSLVASSSSFFAGGQFADHFALMRRHAARSALALLALIFAMKLDYRIYRKMAPMLFAMGTLMVLGLFVFGHTIRDTVRWYMLPVTNTSIQPAEIARLTLVFFLAYWIARSGKQFSEFRRGFLPAAGAIAITVGLIAATPNYGTASATTLIAVIMLFVGGARLLHLAGFMSIGIGIAAVKFMTTPYVRNRIDAFFNQSEGVTEMNWQVHQSLIGLGSGGVFGVGFGNSGQKLNWLPDAYTDFIFSVLGEEVGMIGTVVVSGLFLLLVLRALKISRRGNDTFGEMLVVGIGISIFVYAMLNMLVATGMFPVTGLPLPFLSYGGSAMIVNAFAAGILLNVSRQRPGTKVETRKARFA
jgi:cell division protein FtsW